MEFSVAACGVPARGDSVGIELSWLYMVHVAVSGALAIFWLTFWLTEHDFPAASYFAFANILITGGGAALLAQGWHAAAPVILVTSVMLIAGYLSYLLGIRRLDHHALPLKRAAVMLAGAAGLLALAQAFGSPLAYTLIDGFAQTAALVAAALLLGRGSCGFACRLAVVGFGGGALAVLLRTALVTTHEYHWIEPEIFRTALFSALLLGLLNGLLRNFGLVLMAVSALRAATLARAERDDLTGLPNRRMLRMLLSRAMDGTLHGALLLIDIDRFKSINDRYGHAAGDICLMHFARIAAQQLEADDFIARNGGDEFCLVRPGADAVQAARFAQKLRDALRAEPVHLPTETLTLTLSIGISVWANCDGTVGTAVEPQAGTISRFDGLMERADRALYSVKHQGRDGHAFAIEAITPAGERAAERLARG